LQYKKSADAEWTTVNNITQSFYTIENLDADTSYDVRVESVDVKDKTSGYTDKVTGKTSAQPYSTVSLRVLLQGYYTGAAQRPATVEVELRNPREVVKATLSNVTLDASGNATLNFEGVADGGYYVAVKQIISGAVVGPNHLAVVTQNQIQLKVGQMVNANLSDSTSPDYLVAYKGDLDTNFDAMLTSGSFRLMRGGDANGDGVVNVVDFGLWASANGSKLGENKWKAGADFDGNDLINMLDFGIWAQNNGKKGYVPK
jgi:hypothetical protein